MTVRTDISAAAGPVTARRATWPPVVAVLALVPICVVYLWFPQDADGVLFELGARRMAAGAAFYRDLWDIKQPGIYWVYQAGLALGVGVVGPRLLEIAAALVAGAGVWWLTRGWGLCPAVRVLSPTLVIGSYLLMTHRGGVLSVEGLCNPLFVAVLAASWPVEPAGGAPRPLGGWVLAGVAAGLVGVLKIVYLPLPATLLLGALAASRTSTAGRLARVVAAAAGAAFPLSVATAYFAAHGALGLAWTTTVRVPLASLHVAGLGESRRTWLELLVELSTLLVPLALIGLAGARRRGTVVRELTLLAVVVEAVVLALPQYPTPYRLLVVVAPVALLAVVGADAAWRRAGRARRPGPARVAVVALALVLALPLARGPQRLLSAASQVPSWGLDQRERNARDAVLISQFPARDADPVRSRVRPGEAIYVFGHPQVYQELGAREAVEITGWASTLMPGTVWRERDRELARSRPALIFVEDGVANDVRASSPRVVAMLAADYELLARTPDGVWYATDHPGRPSGVPGDNRLTA